MIDIITLLTVVLVLALAGFVVLAFILYRVPYKDSNGEYLVMHRKPLAPSTPKTPVDWQDPPE
jgi:hypothetical protein